jgi:GT2 family glycosyltransferase
MSESLYELSKVFRIRRMIFMDEIRIQIVNYNTKQYLLECLESLAKDLKDFSEKYSVAVLDNNSDDDLSDIPSLFPQFTKLEIYRSEKNSGFGSGQNFLAKQGNAKYLLLLNPDTQFIESQTVERLLQNAKEFSVAVLGPRLLTGKGETQKWDHGELRGFGAWVSLQTGNSYWKQRDTLAEAAWVSGAAFLVEKRWFDEAYFDEQIFLYKEEEELCWRIRNAGGKILYDPSIKLFHHCGVVAKKSDHIRKSTDYFLDKHFRERFGYRLFKLLNKLMH